MGESISSGILAAWHVADGDFVKKDQVLYELETDKITSEANAEVAGVITIKAAEGDEVEIGQIVAEIDESAEAPDGGEAGEAAPEPKEEPAAKEEKAAEKSPEKSEIKNQTSEMAVSPAVRRIASESGIDPADVAPGSGKGGRVTKGDMLEAVEKGQDSAAKGSVSPTPSPAKLVDDQPGTGERTTRRKMTPLRKKIAQRLVAATNEAALLTTFNEVDMSAVMGARKKFQDDFVKAHGVKLGFMSFFVKAVVDALKAVPAINAQIDGDHIIENHYYDVGVAVGTDKGLMVPVVRDCDTKSFAQIEQDIIGYAKKARDGKIGLDDLNGGVFTISNGGIYGSMLSTPLLNMPQSGILGLHNITQRAVVVDGQIVARPMMYLALSYDHRVVDGKEAVTFLVKVKQAIEDPERMLFGV